MKRIVFMLFLSMTAMVLTTKPQMAYASADNESTSSCTLSYVDVYCAKNPEECQKNSALRDTSVYADFAFALPHHASIQASTASYASSAPQSLFGGNMDSERLFQLVNSYRASVGLPAFQKHPDLCAIASSRGPELAGEIRSGDIHGGMRRRNIPYWVTENMKWGISEEEVLSWWLQSPVHASAINGNNTYACTQCTGPVCVMLFTDFVGK